MATLLKVEGVWKKYSVDLKKTAKYAARDIISTSFGLNPSSTDLRATEFWALRDISIEVKRGEVIGILGRNGAGKSTLLKCIANKVKTDRGNIDLRGDLGHLIEMSAGFSPTMTGRENVRIRGKLTGKTGKELNRYLDQVAEFADIGEFFDAPVQIYSSGMRSRLGFAGSVFIDPDILIIDEVLAVGDLSFRLKCYEKINQLTKNAAVLFVSHSLGHMARLCTRGLYLNKGKTMFLGDIQEAIKRYQDDCEAISMETAGRQTFNPELVSFTMLVDGKVVDESACLSYADNFGILLDVSQLPSGAQIRVLLKDSSRSLVNDWNSFRSDLQWPERFNLLEANLGSAQLNPGAYSLSIQVMGPDGVDHLCMSEAIHFSVEGTRFYDLPSQKMAGWRFIGHEGQTPLKTSIGSGDVIGNR